MIFLMYPPNGKTTCHDENFLLSFLLDELFIYLFYKRVSLLTILLSF